MKCSRTQLTPVYITVYISYERRGKRGKKEERRRFSWARAGVRCFVLVVQRQWRKFIHVAEFGEVNVCAVGGARDLWYSKVTLYILIV